MSRGGEMRDRTLEQLIEKWREEAREDDRTSRTLSRRGNHESAANAGSRGDARRICADELAAALASRPRGAELQTTDQAVIDCMGSEPVCAANGCQFRKTAGYRKGEGPVFQVNEATGQLERASLPSGTEESKDDTGRDVDRSRAMADCSPESSESRSVSADSRTIDSSHSCPWKDAIIDAAVVPGSCEKCETLSAAVSALSQPPATERTADFNDGGFGEAAYCHHRHHGFDEPDERLGQHSSNFDTCPHLICVKARRAANALPAPPGARSGGETT